MTYVTDCSGPIVVDKSNTNAGSFTDVQTNMAIAQYISGGASSQCLYSVTNNITMDNTATGGIIMEIVSNLSGFVPHTSAYLFNLGSPGGITETVVNMLLSSTGPFWIVLSPQYYNPASSLPKLEFKHLEYQTGANFPDYVATKTGSGNWSNQTKKMGYFTTKVQTYAPCTTPTMTMSIA